MLFLKYVWHSECQDGNLFNLVHCNNFINRSNSYCLGFMWNVTTYK